jgi:hypothetical protein
MGFFLPFLVPSSGSKQQQCHAPRRVVTDAVEEWAPPPQLQLLWDDEQARSERGRRRLLLLFMSL